MSSHVSRLAINKKKKIPGSCNQPVLAENSRVRTCGRWGNPLLIGRCRLPSTLKSECERRLRPRRWKQCSWRESGREVDVDGLTHSGLIRWHQRLRPSRRRSARGGSQALWWGLLQGSGAKGTGNCKRQMDFFFQIFTLVLNERS